MKQNVIGIDIGGTKCAVTYGINNGAGIEIVGKLKFDTTQVDETVVNLLETTSAIMQKYGLNAGNTAPLPSGSLAQHGATATLFS